MSTLSKKEAGILIVVVERFEKRIMPRLLAIKIKVNEGCLLDQDDIDFLDKIISEANRSMPHMASNRELHEFCKHVSHTYNKITRVALKNEQNAP